MHLEVKLKKFVCGSLLVAFILVPGALFGVADILDVHRSQPDFDLRTGSVAPAATALAIADTLDATVRWNRFGTPHVMFKEGGFLSTALPGTPSEAAREWVRANRDLFALSNASVDALEVVRESQLVGSDAHVVLFGQTVGDLSLANEGRIKVGVVDGQVFWVSSSAVGEVADPGAALVSPADAWLASAATLGVSVAAADLLDAGSEHSWQLFEIDGWSHPQRVRPVALAVPGAGAVPAYETIVLDVTGGEAMAYTSFVDGNTGEVLVRRNRTWRLLPEGTNARTEPFDGAYQDLPETPACGPKNGPFTVGALDSWARVIVEASAAIPANDIFIRLYNGPTLVAEEDLGTSPETLIYEPVGGIAAGDYFVEVCPYGNPTAPPVAPFTYVGAISFTEAELPEIFQLPKWTFFEANPLIDLSSVDTRINGCWSETGYDGAPIAGCDAVVENSAARAPWDYDFATRQATRTTTGNAAQTSLSWAGPLSPSVPKQPVSADRDYNFPWTNTWHESACDPASLPLADTDAAVANLFVAHNRMHDWSYHLGFTERNGNAQVSNFGLTSPERENDPEVGNAQAGAVVGGFPSYLGRDNANQITLNDGIAPITNMYLWQPIAGAAYPPCVDGDFDMAIVGHEYGHMIQNRMVDPDNGLGGDQGRAMGESWGDLTAIEVLNAYGLVPVGGENPFAVGAYATGNLLSGVRNYPMNDSPLNYSNMDYDPTGLAEDSPHSNGEIWSAVNFDIRQALIAKYNATHPASDLALQARCAEGVEPVVNCPGNRRWVQIMHDAFLLMPSTPTMLDARDAYLAADSSRAAGSAWPSNQTELWDAFAARGLGAGAASNGTADVDPTPSFASPTASNATITVQLLAQNEGNAPVSGEVYIGELEARSVPVADTDSASALGDTFSIAPGTYDIVVRADGYGHHYFTAQFSAGEVSTVTFKLRTNWASTHKGASASGQGSSFASLIDDTESTTWERLGATPDVDGTTVTVTLNGRKMIRRAQVSAMVEPGESRFETLRAFELQACDATVSNCSLASNYTTIYQSADDAFPGETFRPTVASWQMRSFDVPATRATHVRFVVLSNQCTGNPAYQDGALDNDPLNETDCRVGNAILAQRDQDVTTAELQLFSR